jgi:NitT/TauT family transport system substrate-binding protein
MLFTDHKEIGMSIRSVMPSRRALLAGASLALFAPSLRASAQELPVVRVTGPANDAFAPIYWAQSTGLFRRNGVDVQTVAATNGAAAMAAVLGGSAEIALTNMVAVFQAHLRGVPLQIVAPSVLYSSAKPTAVLMVLKEAPFRTARDLNGKTIGSPGLRDLTSASIMAWVDKNGGDSKSLHFIEVPSSSAQPVLEQGRIDAAFMIEPALTQSLATGKTRVFSAPFDAIGDQFMTTAFVGAVKTVDQNRDTMSRFARAMHEAIVYTNGHMGETVDVVAARTGATPDQVAHSTRSQNAEYLDPGSLTRLLEVCVKYGLIDHSFPVAEVLSPVAVTPPRRS